MSTRLLSPDLQTEVDLAARTVAELQAAWPDEVSLRLWDHAIWFEAPYLLLPAFPALRAPDLRPLAAFTRLFASSLLVFDPIADREAPRRDVATATLRIMAMQFEAYRLLSAVFPPDARFWGHFRTYMAQYSEVCLKELSFTTSEEPFASYTEGVALRVAKAKSGCSKVIAAGLCELSGARELLPAFEEAFDHYNVACQMWDDLQDWKEDLLTGTPSLLLARAFPDQKGPLPAETLAREAKERGREVYYGGHAEYILELALRALDGAESLKADFPDLPFWAITAGFRKNDQSTLQDLRTIMERHRGRARSAMPWTAGTETCVRAASEPSVSGP